MAQTSPSKIAAARIPKITDLRDTLGYGDAKLQRCSTFNDDLRVFRRRYYFRALCGTDLWDWKSPAHQHALKQMTASYLDVNKYGERYWPSDPTSPNFNSLQYSKDRLLIHRTMRQLIFRLNLQQYRNTKYKQKEQHAEDEPKPREVINLVDESSPTNFPAVNAGAPSNSTTSHTSTGHHTSTQSANTLQGGTERNSRFDVFDGPASPDPSSEPGVAKRKRDAPRYIQPAKKSKIVVLKVPNSQSLAPNLGQKPAQASWKSPRKRKTVQRSGYANLDDIDQAIASQALRDGSTASRDATGAVHQSNFRSASARTEDESEAADHPNIRQSLEHIEDNRGYTQQPDIEQDSENHRVVLEFIRTNRPSVTSPPSIIGQTDSALDSRIDPNLERAIPPPSTLHQRIAEAHTATSSSFVNPVNKAQSHSRPLTSPAPSTSTLRRASATPNSLPVSQKAEGSSGQGLEAFHSAPSKPAPASSTTPKSSINFNYIVILARTPVYQYKRWTPHGNFKDKSLSELVLELPLDNKENVKGLTIRIEGPGISGEETLGCEEDATFEMIKTQFLRMAKMCFKSHSKTNPGKAVVITLEIEAVREGSVEEEVEDDDDIEFWEGINV